jgi:Tfp pilus assembly protein FimT
MNPLLYGRRAQSFRSAVTIIELVIVVMVMSVLAAAALPAFLDSLLYHRVESAARRLKADMELARQTARLTSSAQSLTFTNSTYALSAGAKNLDDPNAVYFVDLSAAPFEMGSVTADFSGSQTVSFNGFGTPSSGGTIVLTTQGHTCTLTLNAMTGDVTITSTHTL